MRELKVRCARGAAVASCGSLGCAPLGMTPVRGLRISDQRCRAANSRSFAQDDKIKDMGGASKLQIPGYAALRSG